MVLLKQRMLINAPIQRCFDLSRSIEVHLLGTEQAGEQALGGVTTGLIGQNEFVRWRAKHLGIWQHLTSKITAYDSPNYFQDTMIEGAFRFMQHDHYFLVAFESETDMGPSDVCGSDVTPREYPEHLFLKRYMDRFLRHRNEIIRQVAESDSWQDFILTK